MNSTKLCLLERVFSLVRVFLVEKRELGLVSIGGTSRLNLRKIVDRLASVNSFVVHYYQ